MHARLRFCKSNINEISARYSYQNNEDLLISLKATILQRGHLLQKELYQVARWKSPRSAEHTKRNDPKFVEEITKFAFHTFNEQARIETLTLLKGVSWPTASVILHLFHVDPYPIVDYRALWSLSLEVPSPYTFSFWWRYVEICRELSVQSQADMRTLDRALWQYSKESQP